MPITPRDSPSGEPAAELDAGEPKEPGIGEGPPITRTPNVSIALPRPPAADCHEAPTSPDDGRSGMLLSGEVFDLGEGGRYTVKECLGRGGMGEVYLAEHVTPHAKGVVKLVALKVLRPDALPHLERTFIDEVHVLSALRHEHIARYLNFFVDKGRQVLVMEYVEGRSLHSIVELARRKGRRLSEPTSLELLAQVADALGYAHAAKDADGRSLNIVHRDVSPGNIMVTSSGQAILVDFGVAKADLAERTPPGSRLVAVAGKLPYMSPEQALGLRLNGRSDVFSLGTVLVEMLTGEPPFGRGEPATWAFLVKVKPEYVDAKTRGLSRKVRAICRKALEHSPGMRFADAREMATAMLAGLPRRSSGAVMEEIAALEALPDASPEAVERVERIERDLRRVTGQRRAAEVIAALVCAAAACFFFWSAYSSTPTANAPMKPGATTPEVAETAPVAPLPRPAKGPINEEMSLVSEHSARPVTVATKKARIPSAVTAPPTGRRGDGAVSLSDDSDKSMGPLRDELVTAKTSFEAMAAKYVKVSGEALSPQHALATLFATGHSDDTDFSQASRRQLTLNGVTVVSVVWMNRRTGTVVVVVDLPNPNDAPPWEPLEGRIISDAGSSSESPVALRALPRVIPPGQRGRVALVFNRSAIADKAIVEILRDSRPDFGIEVSSQELEQHNSPWRSLWHFGQQ